MRSGSPDKETLARLRKAAEGGRSQEAWVVYVAALRAAGQKDRARKSAKKAPFPGPVRKALLGLAEGRTAKGLVPRAPLSGLSQHVRRGEIGRFRQEAAKALSIYPQAPEIIHLLSVAALLDEDAVEAEKHLRGALRADPENVDYIANLGLAMIWQGRADDAIDLLEPHIESAEPGSAISVNLASAYLRAERNEEAQHLAARVIDAAPHDIEAQGVFFAAALSQGRIETARAAFDALSADMRARLADVAIELIDLEDGRQAALRSLAGVDPEPALRARLSRKLAAWGELETAARLLREGLERGEGGPNAFRSLGTLTKWTEGDPLLTKLEAEAARRDQSPGRRASLLLSLAKARADTGDTKEAFAAARDGKEIWADSIDYDAKREWQGFERILSAWPPETVSRLSAKGPHDWHPIFIIGLPRSGSTLIETILSRHPDVRSIGESPRAFSLAARARPSSKDIEAMRDALSSLLKPRHSGERVTDKLLANFKHVGPLMAAFPSARFLYPDRDYRATGLSIFENPLSPVDHPYSLSLERIARHMVNCHRMVEAWQKHWPTRVWRISYEALVSRPDIELPKLVEAAGLDWDERVAQDGQGPRRIDTLSVAQARGPISRTSVDRWRRHEADLAPMIEILSGAGLIADEA